MTSRSSLAALCGAALILAIFVSACGGAASSAPAGDQGTPPTGATQAPGAGGTAAPGGSAQTTGHVGDKLSVTMLGGDKADVTLVKVFDPATPTDPNNAAPSGARWVGLEIVAVDHATDAGGHQVLVDGVGSDGKPITTDGVFKGTAYEVGDFNGCSSASTFMDTDQPNTTCPAFLVPSGVTLVSVGVQVGGAEIGGPSSVDQASWMVP